MHRILLSLLFFLAAPAAAYASAESCMPAGPDTGYVQRGDDLLLIECPAMEGGAAACTCHEPPGENGECRTFECSADGSPKVAEVKPAPLAQEEKAAPAPKAEAPKPAAKKKKAKPAPVAAEKKTEATSAPEKTEPAPAPVEEKKADAPPVQEGAKPAPAPAVTGEKKIEYTR